ncbi:MAG: hypothetical protein AAGK09_11340 [Planctomycetota bacterium]
MTKLPQCESTPLIRTDFSDDETWAKVCQAVTIPVEDAGFGMFKSMMAMVGQDVGEGLQADVTAIDDRAFEGMMAEALLAALPEESGQAILLVADRQTIQSADHPILIIDLIQSPGRSFRSIPSEIQTIENNLSLANCDWEDFANNVDSDGIYRGIKE